MIACLIIIVITLVSYSIDKRIGSKISGNSLIICGLTTKQLLAPVTGLYLITAKLFPIVNARLTGHWSVIVETPCGYFNISTARYMSIYLYQAFKDGAFYFTTTRWENRLYILNKYKVKEEYIKNPINVYDVSNNALNFYSKNGSLTYSMVNNNCQQIAQYIIESFGVIDKDDELMRPTGGLTLVSQAMNDVLLGPKIIF